MIPIHEENLLPIREVPAELPARHNGKRVHPSTVYRWTKIGVRGIRLECVGIGGRTYTSIEAIQRFGECLGEGVRANAPLLHTGRSRKREIIRAEERLAKILGRRGGRAY